MKTKLIILLTTIVLTLLVSSPRTLRATSGYALQFYGNGTGDIDRVKIQIEPHVNADVGGDFTIEFWMKTTATGGSCTPSSSAGDGWITGRIIIDRDVYGGGDYGDYGASLAGGRICFGVALGSTGATIYGSTNVADGQWHHIALTRNTSTGQIRIFVDGQSDASGTGPTGNISYRDGRSTSYPNSDPFLVLGAEKHDAGSAYPSYIGLLDDVRISNIVRYTATFTRPSAPHAADSSTVALYRFDEGSGTTIVDSAPGGNSPGVRRYGGSPAGPVYVTDTPFNSTPSPQRLYLPLILRDAPPPPTSPAPPSASEWSQHAHDAQHTSYTAQVVAPPWRWRWAWNGPNASGGIAKVTTSGSLPRNVQPVTGGGRVYIAAGVDGVFALSETTGQSLWQRNGIGDVRSTVTYDHDTQAVFVVSANGTLYKLRASDGAVLAQFNSGQSSTLPLPPAVISDRVLFAMGNAVYAVNKQTMQQIWAYDAQATIATPPAYSSSRNAIIVATEPDLYVHAINNSDGTRKWRVRPIHSSRNFADPTEYRYGWPVIADNAGYALIKVRLDWQVLWRDWPQTNSAMRQFLTNNPGEQALFVLNLDNGTVPFIANVGHGGYGDSDYLPMGPQPVVKRLANGKEIVYIVIRAKHAYDSRWDSHFGEMMLDSTTVSGLQGGDVRFIAFDWPPGYANPYLLTDEQPNVAMAGDYLFGGHWEAGFAMQILDRSDARGSFTNKITTQRLATIATSQDNTGACAFSASHYCASGLENTRGYDFGFYIYYNQGAVYDRYWSEYANWVVSNDNIYFRSCDGAIVALMSGNPQSGMTTAARATPTLPTPSTTTPPAILSPTQARAWAGHRATVAGTLRYVFNNGKHVLLGFAYPHQGTFKIIIRREAWQNFAAPPERLYRVSQVVAVSGTIQWYQGDPAIFVTTPEQIQSQ
jgi:hypothetical protein